MNLRRTFTRWFLLVLGIVAVKSVLRQRTNCLAGRQQNHFGIRLYRGKAGHEHSDQRDR